MNLTDQIRFVLAGKAESNVWSVEGNATVFEALQLMAEKNVGALLVIEGGKLRGILSERDYARKVILVGKTSRETLVHEIMSPPSFFATPESTVDECMRMMSDKRIRHLPVVDGTEVVGMVSIGDLVNWIISAQEETINQLHAYVTGQYPR
ncbi:MAG TPA: CBS domain-containing protein [Bryobacteraceae bacterium]|nr:CBS domain-containing protein [Bryobacteraceae bacterium]